MEDRKSWQLVCSLPQVYVADGVWPADLEDSSKAAVDEEEPGRQQNEVVSKECKAEAKKIDMEDRKRGARVMKLRVVCKSVVRNGEAFNDLGERLDIEREHYRPEDGPLGDAEL
nr:hypothetical protein BaRGS_034659 [Batillaria attramentaria]